MAYVRRSDLYGLGFITSNLSVFKRLINPPSMFTKKTPEEIAESKRRIAERQEMIASLPPSSFKVIPSGDIPERPTSGTLAVKSALELGGSPLEFQMPWDQMILTREKMWGHIPVWIQSTDLNYRIATMKHAKLRGEVEIMFEGKSLGRIPYCIAKKIERTQRLRPETFGSRTARRQSTPEENLKAFIAKGKKGMYGGWVDGYRVSSTLTQAGMGGFPTIGSTKRLGSQFAETYGETMEKVKMTGAMRVTTLYTGFNYSNPDSYVPVFEETYPEQSWNDIEMYYNIVDNPNKVQILIDQGYEDPTAELGSRIELNAKWPLNKACKYFWLSTMRHGVGARLNAFSPADGDKITKAIIMTPRAEKGAVLLLGEPSVQKVLKAFNDNFGLESNADKQLYGSRVNMLQRVLAGAMEAIKDRHFWCFNYPYWNYIVEGGMPATFVMTSQKEYNRLQKKKAKKSGIQKIVGQVLGLALLAVPGAGLALSTVYTSALKYSNYQSVQSQVKVQERQSKEIEQETQRVAQEVQEEIKQIEVKQADTQKEQVKSGLKKGLTIAGIVGAGFLAVTQIMDN